MSIKIKEGSPAHKTQVKMCHGQKWRFFGDGKPHTFNRNPYNGYINPYYWVDDHPLLYGNNASLDPGTYVELGKYCGSRPQLRIDQWLLELGTGSGFFGGVNNGPAI